MDIAGRLQAVFAGRHTRLRGSIQQD
jgi:hypothetical protein